MLKNAHVSAAEVTRRPMADNVALCSVILDWIGTTVRLERAIRASRHAVGQRRLNETTKQWPTEDLLIRVVGQGPQSKRLVTHFREHPCLIRRVYLTVVIVHYRADPC